MIDRDALTPLGLRAPDDLAERLGYDGDARYVATWWTPHGDEAMVSDGYVTFDGDWRAYVRFQRAAGGQALAALGIETDTGLPTPLDVLLARVGVELGSSETAFEHALVIDRADRALLVGEWAAVDAFLREHNDRDATRPIDADRRDAAPPEGMR